MANSQSRKWLLTINNPLDMELNHEKIIEITKKFMPDYFCLSDEIAPTTGTYHTHLFIYSKSPIRFSTIKGRFPMAHIDKAYGSALENRDYILKEGKWKNDAKAETCVPNSFFEWGEIPAETEEKEPIMASIIEDIKSGKTVKEIVELNPKYALKVKEIELLRQIVLADISESQFRDIECIYLWGKSGVGKTGSIYQENEPKEIYRITSYRKNGMLFDGYNSHKVLVFEEFQSSIPIGEMLHLLDIYPMRLPARYSDKVAFYTRVYIVSTEPLEHQYTDIQSQSPEMWKAFVRRITKIRKINEDGTVIDYSKDGEILEK